MPCCGENGPEATVWEGEEAVHWLGAVVAEQEKYLAAITTFSFTMNERWTTRLDELARDGINEWNMEHRQFEKGPWLRVERSGTAPASFDGGKRTIISKVECLVMNDRYVAQAHTPSAAAYLREHASIDALPPQSRDALSVFDARGPRRHGFGNGNDSLAQILRSAQTRKDLRLRVDRVAGPDRLYSLRAFYKKSLIFEMVLDGEHGFLATETRRYGPDGFLNEEIALVPAEIMPGMWFPKEWRRMTYDVEAKPTERRVIQTTFNEITSIEVNPDLDDALFTWQTMPLGPAVQMFRHDVAGEFQIMDIVDGELVPEELVKKMAPGGFGNREGAENQQSRRKTIGMKLR